MLYVRSKTNNIGQILLFLNLYFNNETLSNNLCTIVKQPCQYVCMATIVYGLYYMSKNKVQFGMKAIAILCLFLLCIMLIGIFDSSAGNAYFLITMNLVTAFIIPHYMGFPDFVKTFVRSLSILAVFSLLITYSFRPLLFMLPLEYVTNSAEIPFINVILCYVPAFDGYMRNTGIFREAGVWGTMLCIGFILLRENKYLFQKKEFLLTSVLFILTILSTFSAASFLTIITILCIQLLDKQGRKENGKFYLGIGACVLILLAVGMVDVGSFTESTDKLSADSSSFQYRTSLFSGGFELILSNPIGYGLTDGNSLLFGINTMDHFHNTSTFLGLCIYFGVLSFIIYIVSLCRFCRKRLGKLLYIIPFVIICNSEMYIYNVIFYTLMFYGVNEISDIYDLDENNDIKPIQSR